MEKAARAVSGVLHPALWVPAFLTLSVIWLEQDGSRAAWAAVMGGAGALAPAAVAVLRLVGRARRGRGCGERPRLFARSRREVLALTGAGAALTLGLLVWLRAPASLLASLVGVLAAVLAITGLNAVYRASFHLGILASLCMLAVLRFGPWAAFSFAALLPLGWARHYLDEHTPGQMAVGGALGTAAAAGAWLAATLTAGALHRAGWM